MKKMILLLSLTIGAQFAPIKANGTKVATAVGIAGILGAGIYAWNKLKPLTNKQIIARGEAILARGACYEPIISLLHRDLDSSHPTLSTEMLTATESLSSQSISAFVSELKTHAGTLAKRITFKNPFSEQTSMNEQLEKTNSLMQDLTSVVPLEIVAQGEKMLADSAAYRQIMALPISLPEDSSEEAVTALGEHAAMIAKLVHSEQMLTCHYSLLDKTIGVIIMQTPISRLLLKSMTQQRAQIECLLQCLKVLTPIYNSHQGYFSLCSSRSKILSDYSNELTMLTSQSSERKTARMLVNTIIENYKGSHYPLLAYTEKITRDMQALTPTVELTSRYQNLSIQCNELRAHLDQIKTLILTTQEYWKSASESNNRAFENYRQQQETSQQKNADEIDSLRSQLNVLHLASQIGTAFRDFSSASTSPMRHVPPPLPAVVVPPVIPPAPPFPAPAA